MLLAFDVCCGAPARAINPTIRLTETPKLYFQVVQVTGKTARQSRNLVAARAVAGVCKLLVDM